MTDIIDRLQLGGPNALEVTDEAADEIDRLRAVLRYISQLDDDGDAPVLARAALEPKP